MKDPGIDRMRGDVLLARHDESSVGIGNDELMDVAVRATDVDVCAAVVGDQRGVLAAPQAEDTFRRPERTRRIARAKYGCSGCEGQGGFGEHRNLLTNLPSAIHLWSLCAP